MNKYFSHIIFPLLMTALATSSLSGAEKDFAGAVYPLPESVSGVSRSVISLDGTWNFRYSKDSRWTTIKVPGEAAMQGYAIKHGTSFFYRRTVQIPSDFKGKRVILRFNGVYSVARLSVNGQDVRRHCGGFTRWETDITPYVKPGRKAVIDLEIVDPVIDVSYASGYAHHPIGGILRSVCLFALPENHIYDVKVETDLDSLYKDADIVFSCMSSGEGGTLRLSLTAPDGSEVKKASFELKKEYNEFRIPVQNPLKWDAEHPNLYKLNVSLFSGDGETLRFSKDIGFRKIEIKGTRMLVNGRQVKLRGACRHDMDPEMGRSTNRALDSLDARLFKEANMNFVRTSHYPPSEDFVHFCDVYGIYVESETAVCFVNTHRQRNYYPGSTQDSTEFRSWYLGQMQEEVKNFQSHPSVLLWSLGNESQYGSNFQATYDWVREYDRTRPTIFSYPGSDNKEEKIYQILSMHYPSVGGTMEQWGCRTVGYETSGMPAIFDEWAHPACYVYETLQRDPNIREFWGKSIDLHWDGVYTHAGALGGAIWGYVDEIFELPEPKVGTAFWKEFAHTQKPLEYEGKCVGYGNWGIVDIWRRPKPEFWATKKGYAPVRLVKTEINEYAAGMPLYTTVANRFDHTSLNEIRAVYEYAGEESELKLPAIGPHEEGLVEIPAHQWKDGDKVLVKFYAQDGHLINADQVTVGIQNIQYPGTLNAGKLSIDKSDVFITVRGDGFVIPVNLSTGLIENAEADGSILIEKGPFLNASILCNGNTPEAIRKASGSYRVNDSLWTKRSIAFREGKSSVTFDVAGSYGDINLTYSLNISNNGTIAISYKVDGMPRGYCRESGLLFKVSYAFAHLDWQRDAYWNYYEDDAFAGDKGSISLYESNQAAYGQRPSQPWHKDTHDYYYWSDRGANCDRPITVQAKGMKENIFFYTLSKADGHQLSVISKDASVACRTYKQADGSFTLYVNNQWDYPEISRGNYCKAIDILPCYGQIRMTIK